MEEEHMQSMTGFGIGTVAGEGFVLTVEARSVNHKSLSISVNLPESISSMEPVVRTAVQERFSRGRIRVEARLDATGEGGSGLLLDIDAARAYLVAAERLRNELGSQGDIPVFDLLRLSGVMERADSSGLDSQKVREALGPALASALDQLRQSRSAEGRGLEEFFREGFHSISRASSEVAAVQRDSVEARFMRLRERVAELVGQLEVDQDRMLQELAIIAERSDITEELHRLSSHIENAVGTLSSGSAPVGRKLEFIIQEMHRELNTMGSKADDSRTCADIVDMKSTLATLKEQAANVE